MRISGIVKRHKGLGKKLGFPTANVNLQADIPDGIYVGVVGPMEMPALIFIGAAKTFGETEKNVEIYILDFEENIYGQQIEVEILAMLRRNKKFRNEKELIKQMKEDERQAREYFTNTMELPSPGVGRD